MARLDLVLNDKIKEMLKVISDKEGRSMTKEIEQLIKEKYKEIS